MSTSTTTETGWAKWNVKSKAFVNYDGTVVDTTGERAFIYSTEWRANEFAPDYVAVPITRTITVEISEPEETGQ